jgi:hypothetical protein
MESIGHESQVNDQFRYYVDIPRSHVVTNQEVTIASMNIIVNINELTLEVEPKIWNIEHITQ